MVRELELRGRQLGGVMFFVVMIALLAYLGFAALHSEHGLIRFVQVEEQERELREALANIRAERVEIATRTAQLSGNQPDLDLLDERARHALGLGRPDELIIR